MDINGYFSILNKITLVNLKFTLMLYMSILHIKISIFVFILSIAFNTVQVISRQVVGRAEETSTYSLLGLCTVNCQPTASNYHLSHLRS